jgi:2-polyprenyl-6-methoxyphenol hydroxylase-like FAD-dependent oxidoreductase
MKRAVVVGGSVGGLLAGNMLLRQGWQVDVFERSWTGLESRGAGIAPQRSLLDALQIAGIEVADDIGVPIATRRAYDRDGSVSASCTYRQKTTSWGLIYSKLLDAFPSQNYHRGARQIRFIEHPDGVTTEFEDGRSVEADLLVGADGMRSNVRRQLFPNIEPRYAGYVAWRGVLDESRVSSTFVDKYFGSFSFALLPSEEFICYPVAGTDGSTEVGRRRFNMMWYRPVKVGPDFDELATGTDGVLYPGGIPPTLIKPVFVASMKDDARRFIRLSTT